MSVNHLNQVKTREEYKKIKEDERKGSVDAATKKAPKVKDAQKVSKAAYAKKRIRIRLIPIWLRIILLLVLTVGFMVAGTAVGYSLLGDGNAGDVLKQTTWTHILDLVEKK